jgi:hypothetical protein
MGLSGSDETDLCDSRNKLTAFYHNVNDRGIILFNFFQDTDLTYFLFFFVLKQQTWRSWILWA